MFKDIIYSAPVLTALSSVIVSASVYCFMSVKKFIDRKVDHRFRLKIDERERSIGLITNLVEFAVSEGAQVLSGAKYSGEKIGKTDQVRKRSLTFVQRQEYAKQAALNVIRSAVGQVVEEDVKMPSKDKDGKPKIVKQKKFRGYAPELLNKTLGSLGKFIDEGFAHHVIEGVLHKKSEIKISSIIRGMLINKNV